MKKIKITLYVDSNGTHLHQIYSGLYLLDRSGRIALNLRLGSPLTKTRTNRQFITMLVQKGNKSSLCVFDGQDSFEPGLPDVLNQCDVYFKRSLEKETFDSVNPAFHSRLKPFGFNYQVAACSKTMFVKRLMLEYVSRPYNPLAVKNGFHISNMKELFDASWRGRHTYMLSQNQLRPMGEDFDDCIIFQCRLWDPDQLAMRNRADTEKVNEQRIGLVRSLKKEFGSNFVGGLQHNDYARRVAPDLLIVNPVMSKRSEYIRMVRRAGIVISSPGLVGSNGWKLGEYVALGKCIVSEPIHTLLPGRFVPNEQYVPYDSIESCVQ